MESDKEDSSALEISLDFKPVIYFSKKNEIAVMIIFPPIGGGKHVEYGLLMDFLKQEGIKNGINDKLIHKIAENREYMRLFAAAKGELSEDGQDGKVIEHIPREIEILYAEDESGNVDFKEMDLFKQISKGDLICDIILPTEGKNGVDVKGNIIAAKKGKNAFVPKGINTVLSEDGTKLLAGIDGYISFQNGLFRIAEVLEISGDVDLSVGNLNFNGDIVIRGDVHGGFKINADGNIIVCGMVEDSFLNSGGDITIHKGMNGNHHGELHAKGNIRCTFLENTTIFAEGDIIVNSLVCCKVFCDRSVFVEDGLGVIIGGSIMAMQSVKARIIGTKANRKSEITLGTLPHIVNECEELKNSIKNIDEVLSVLHKNITYLRGLNELSKQKTVILSQAEEQFKLYTEKKESMLKQLEMIKNQMGLAEQATITCSVIYPPVRININGQIKNIDEMSKNAKIFLSKENEVVVSSLIEFT